MIVYHTPEEITHILYFCQSIWMSHIFLINQDVKELQLTENSEYKVSADKGDAYVDHSKAKYICPVTGIEMSGRYR